MPNASATRQACCPPAPPKQASARIVEIVAALDRDALDRLGHIFDGHGNKAVRHGTRIAANLARQILELLPHRFGIEVLIGLGSENLRKEARHDLADHQIGIGHGQRPAFAVAGRARIGTGRIGTDREAHSVVMQDRAAARRHRVDQHHRRAHPHAGNLGLETALIGAVVAADIGRCAAHVEADDAIEARHSRRTCRADHAAGGTRQQRILATQALGFSQAAAGLHQEQPRFAQPRCHLVHMAAENRRDVSIGHRGRAHAAPTSSTD